MKIITGVLTGLLLLGGCSTSEGESETAAAEAKATPEPVSLRETCPEVEAGLPGGAVPPASAWSTYQERLEELRAAGDTETSNALEHLMPAVEELAGDPSGTDLLDARSDLRGGLDVMAERCSAVGSSALQ